MGGNFSFPGRASENPVNGLLQQPGLARRAKSVCQSICNFFMEVIAKTRLMKGKLPNGPDENVMAGRKNDISDQLGVVIPKEAVSYCRFCDLFFRSWKKLKYHLLHNHRGKKYRRALKCDHCLAGFKQLKSLERHVSTGKHSFPYRVSKITISTSEGDQVFEVLEVPAGSQGTTVSLRDGVLAN